MTFLGSLLPEVVILIVEQLRLDDDLVSLRSLCLVNSGLRSLAEPALYKKVLLSDEQQCIRLLTSIMNYPRRALGVAQIEVIWTYGRTGGLGAISEIVSKACNLKELLFEGPLCNRGGFRNHSDQWGGFMPNLIDMLVQARQHGRISLVSNRLKKLVLHWQWGCWTRGGNMGVLFSHPSLEDLTISCAQIDESVLDDIHDMRKTPLRLLTLIECNVNHEGLHKVLSMPAALEYLYLGENNHYPEHAVSFRKSQLLSSDTRAFFDALSQQDDSLRTLTYKPSDVSEGRSSLRSGIAGSGFAKFERLTSLKLEADCPDVLSILQDPFRRPPYLQTLRMYTNAESAGNATVGFLRSYPHLEEWSVCLAQIPTLRQLEVILPHIVLMDGDIETYARISERCNTGNEHIRTTIILERNLHGRYIPPYLYNEQRPCWTLVFDSESSDQAGVSQDIPYDPFAR